MTNLDDYIPATDAARLNGYANNTLYRTWAREGRIPGAIKLGRDWLLPRAWVDSQPPTEERRGPGRPVTTGAGLKRKRPAYKPTGKPKGRPKKQAEPLPGEVRRRAQSKSLVGVLFSEEEPPPKGWGEK
jgi:hypothetical protein